MPGDRKTITLIIAADPGLVRRVFLCVGMAFAMSWFPVRLPSAIGSRMMLTLNVCSMDSTSCSLKPFG